MDFRQHLTGLTVKPFDASPRDETLVLIPVALQPFTTAAAEVAKKAVKETKEESFLRNADEKAVYAALEKLCEEEDRPWGYSPAEIKKIAGLGGRRNPAMMDLVARKVLCYGRESTGMFTDGQDGRHLHFRIPTGPDDFTEVLIATDGDLE